MVEKQKTKARAAKHYKNNEKISLSNEKKKNDDSNTIDNTDLD